MIIYSLDILLFIFGTSSMSSSNCCFLTCIQIFQEAVQVVWYSHLFQNFPQFIVIHKVKSFGIVNKAEIDVFFWNSCFSNDPADVGNLISGSSAFCKTSLIIWKFSVHVLLKPGLGNFKHYFCNVWDECNCAVVWAFFGIAFLWDWNENWPFPVLWPLLSFPNLLADGRRDPDERRSDAEAGRTGSVEGGTGPLWGEQGSEREQCSSRGGKVPSGRGKGPGGVDSDSSGERQQRC